MVEQLPVTEKTVKQKIRYFNYLVVVFMKNKNKQILISKRNNNDIWKNMYDFPLIESDRPLSDDQIVSSELWLRLFQKIHPTLIKRTKLYKHILSHQILLTQFNIIAVQGQASLIGTEGYLPVNIQEFKKYPVPRLIEMFFEEFLIENKKKCNYSVSK
jgi:A/G-specific adenine glycosylase